MREEYGNVERIVCPKDGPTSKADCLNWVYEGIRHYEKEHQIQFQMMVMEDSEDVLHPLTLKLFNYMIPRMDMVQLPVLPMEPPWWEFTRGTYLDEFAINHSRDMVVREFLSRNLPSAGVGTALSRSLMQRLYDRNQHRLFTIGSVTEDYDFGIRLATMPGVRQIFSHVRFQRTVHKTSLWTGRERLVQVRDLIGIREFFPTTFRAAVRQKSRWVIGITLQGWEHIGWIGGFWLRYMLLRDRISLLTTPVTMLANLLVPVYLLAWGYVLLFPGAYHFPAIVEAGTALYHLLLINLAFLIWQLLHRCYYVAMLYGPVQAVLSVPRAVWGNIINFFATTRALRLYLKYLVAGAPIAWDKTDHAYPSEEELVRFRRRLGDLLLERRFVTVQQLDQALERQKKTGQKLGTVLVDMGFLADENLLQALGMQFSVTTTEVDPYAVDKETIALIPEDLALRYQIFPVDVSPGGAIIAVVDALPSAEDLRFLEKQLNRSIELRLTTRGELSFALRRGYERLRRDTEEARLGQDLLEQGLISSDQLNRALRLQRQRYRKLGDILLSQGAINESQLDIREGMATPSGAPLPLGEALIKKGIISRQQLDKALEEQRRLMPRLGDLLVQSGAIDRAALEAVVKNSRRTF